MIYAPRARIMEKENTYAPLATNIISAFQAVLHVFLNMM